MKKIDLACIIDDDPVFVFGARKILELGNYCKAFVIYNDGQEAIESLQKLITAGEKIPDVILLDINMPVMDGWQFLDEFTKINTNKKVTIYIVSSSVDPADHKKARNYSEISNFIIKPITPNDIESILRDM